MKSASALLIVLGSLVAVQRGQQPQPATQDPLDGLVQRYLWSTSDSDRRAAEAALTADPSVTTMSRERFYDLEQVLRRGRASYPQPPAKVDGRYPVVEMMVDVPAGPPVPLLVQ